MTDTRAKILLVEDDLDVAEMLNAYFKLEGYEVFTVSSGEDGVRSAHSAHPEIVLLDIRLPDIDGYEVARRLRADRRSADIPIIFLTEKNERADRLHGLSLGGDDYITKPFDVQELRLRVRNSLQRISFSPLTNSITGLPEGALVEEKLNESLARDDLAAVLISVSNVDAFRESYGFVAADDVLRALSLMALRALTEAGRPDDFLGHITLTDFVVLTPTAGSAPVCDALQTRFSSSMDFFYPLADRDHSEAAAKRLHASVAQLPQRPSHFANAERLKAELLRLRP